MGKKEFDILVQEGISAIPEKFLRLLENVEIVIEDAPTQEQRIPMGLGEHETLFGLYEGIPQIQRNAGYIGALPDKITIFRKPILETAQTPGEVRKIVKDTVWHEIAHHFGIEEDGIAILEDRRKNRSADQTHENGFTLIELLVVIGIMGILGGIVLANIGNVRENARIAAGKKFERSVFGILGSEITGKWDAEQGSSVLSDSSGRGNHGTIVGAVFMEGIKGNALQFNGASDHVHFPSPFFSQAPQQFAVSLWARPLSSSPLQDQVMFYHAANGEFMVAYSTQNKFFFSFQGVNLGWQGVVADKKSPPGRWYHVAASFDEGKNTAEIYVNGNLRGRIQLNDSLLSPSGTPSVGAYKRPGGVSNHFYGALDEIKLYTNSIQQ